eukprot:82772_1
MCTFILWKLLLSSGWYWTKSIIMLLVLWKLLLSSGWRIGQNPLPQPLGGSQMIYNNLTTTVYIFGGFALDQSDIVYSSTIYKRNLSNPSRLWTELDINTPEDVFVSQIQNSITIGNITYFIGINNGSYSSNQVYLFDVATEQFISHSVPDYKFAACSGCLTTNNTHIFMLGGFNAPTLVKYIQILNIKFNYWTYLEINLEFIKTGWSSQLCSMVNNTLYVFGGIVEYSPMKAINAIYKYNALSSTWSFIGNLSNFPSGWSLYSVKYNKIYIVSIPQQIGNNMVHVFDLNTEKVIFKNELIISVSQTPCLIYNDSIIIFGGIGCVNNATTAYSPFIQIQQLPLNQHSSGSTSNCISTALFAGMISTVSVIGIVLGCVIGVMGYKYISQRPNDSFHRIM